MATDSSSSIPHIVLTQEQAQAIRSVIGPVELRDAKGDCIGQAQRVLPDGWTEEDIRLAKQARDSGLPRYTTAQVLDHLRSLKRE